MSPCTALLGEMEQRGIELWIEGESLRYRAPQGTLTPELLDRLRAHKQELLLALPKERPRTPAPLRRLPRDKNIPLSLGQKRLWFLDQLGAGGANYNLPMIFRLKGELDLPALEQSLNEILRRHEILRTSFPTVDGKPVQSIRPQALLNLTPVELGEDPGGVKLHSFIHDVVELPFDLERDLLLRAVLADIGRDERVLVMVVHHMVFDGWSIGIFLKELTLLYRAFSQSECSPLSELTLQYADFVGYQQMWLDKGKLATQLSYWKKKLNGAPPLLELPTDRPRPGRYQFSGRVQRIRIDAELTRRVKELGREQGASPFMTLLASFALLLSRYSGQKDLVIGSPVAGRSQNSLEGVIGFFINTLALRIDLSANPSFREILKRVRQVALEAYTNQQVPFEKVVEELNPERNLSYPPLCQVALILHPPKPPNLIDSESRLTIEPVPWERVTAGVNLDLVLSLEEGNAGVEGTIEYNAILFDADTVERMARHLVTIFEGVVSSPDTPVHELPLLVTDERRLLVSDWNSQRRPYPLERTLPDLFEEEAALHPDRVALEFQEERLSFCELNWRANQLAHHLIAAGAGPERLVGICLERSISQVVTILGVLKAGSAYLPMDPSYPKERLRFMLEDSSAFSLIVEGDSGAELSLPGLNCIRLDHEEEAIRSQKGTNPERRVEPGQLAYIIYTSGSSGKPKGVLLEHRGLCNLVHAQIEGFHISDKSRILQFASVGFDASVSEIFTALRCGATLVLAPRELLCTCDRLGEFLRRERISVATLPPSLLAILASEEFPELATVVSAGEPCSEDIARRWCRGRHFINAYGPTEATVCATLMEYDPDRHRKPPIGRPLPNTEVYLLDEQMQPVPIGVIGELYVGGVQVGRGYLNRPELTRERFVANPLETGSSRLYRTGDLARYLPDGVLEFMGRSDDQVKIRGFRIELGEIENTLRNHPALKDAAVVVRENNLGNKHLIAYLVPAEQERCPENWRPFLQETLPDYMIPSFFVNIKALPVTPNGKVARRALPPPLPNQDQEGYLAPRNHVEASLQRVWEELLQRSPIGVRENFFAIGGHSLLAVQVVMKLRELFGREIPVAVFYQGGTIEELASLMSTPSPAIPWSPVVRIREGSRPPVFCLHPVGGDILCYRELAHTLEPEQTLYGIQAVGINPDQQPEADLVLQAKRYIDEVRLVQPVGHYRLLGWSTGALVAYEMAQQFRQQGEDVAFLGMIDPTRPGGIPGDVEAGDLFLADFARFNGLEPAAISGLSQKEKLSFLLEEAYRKGTIPDREAFGHISRLQRVFEANLNGARCYRPTPYPGRLTMFFPQHNPNPYEPWQKLASQTELHHVPGDHYSLLQGGKVERLAQILSQSLKNIV